jgi:hypothetical protein
MNLIRVSAKAVIIQQGRLLFACQIQPGALAEGQHPVYLGDLN